MAFLETPLIRLALAGALTWLSLWLHMDVFGPTNPVGMAAIYFIFVGYAWAGANFLPKLLGKSVLYALPNLFIPPLIVVPLKKMAPGNPAIAEISENLALVSWIIGILMSVYSMFMVGWMLQASRTEATKSAVPADS